MATTSCPPARKHSCGDVQFNERKMSIHTLPSRVSHQLVIIRRFNRHVDTRMRKIRRQDEAAASRVVRQRAKPIDGIRMRMVDGGGNFQCGEKQHRCRSRETRAKIMETLHQSG